MTARTSPGVDRAWRLAVASRVLAAIVGGYLLTPAIQLATRLRGAGVRTQLYTEQKKFKAKMNYADKLGVPYVVFLGDDEIAAGLVACKDMTSGEQTKLPFDATLSRIQEGLSQRNQGKVILEK